MRSPLMGRRCSAEVAVAQGIRCDCEPVVAPAASSGHCEGIMEPIPEADRQYQSAASFPLGFVLEAVGDEDSRKLFDLGKHFRPSAR